MRLINYRIYNKRILKINLKNDGFFLNKKGRER